ncbi:MAG TPA: hypothetical protein VM011_01550 [Gammaproteobacteria bacterium]|nr:hypothetical protein [Gammaproteobacteria bacterium]
MFSSSSNLKSVIGDFHIDSMMRYSLFVPRLYNLCKSLGFEPGKIMPSRAFCSDESQGFPIILITKHFGTFPFNHGMVGGIVATDRHGPHAQHGKDLVIIQASHVGYDPDTRIFGTYRRLQTQDCEASDSCGKIGDVLNWYLDEYAFACENIFLEKSGDQYIVTIDNQLLNESRGEGLFLNLERIVRQHNGSPQPARTLSTARSYPAADVLVRLLPETLWTAAGRTAIGVHLVPELFRFKRDIGGDIEGRSHLERNLLNPMPWIVTSTSPLLVAAQVNTQAEFDRAYRSIVKEKRYRDKRMVFVSCLNIDISPRPGQTFPLTKCVPWAAYIQDGAGSHHTLEQAELVAQLRQQSTENTDQIDLESAIHRMEQEQEIKIEIRPPAAGS